MADGRISVEETSLHRAIGMTEARNPAWRMRWPLIFRRSETLVLPSIHMACFPR